MSDLISRADAIEAVADAITEERSVMNCGLDMAIKIIKTLPSADAVQGEWVDVKNEPYCECSVCGSYIDNLDDDYAFCPRCGARMKGRKLEKLGILEATEEPSYYIRPSAEPTVIRSRTLLPTKDFKEWAKRIREVNPNAVVIPCDAEVVSADDMGEIVRCKDCKHYESDGGAMMICNLQEAEIERLRHDNQLQNNKQKV